MAGRKARGSGRNRPGYLLHKPSGQARVVLSGRNHYLGPHGSPESDEKYAELVKGWEANGRRPTEYVPTADETLQTVANVCDAYLEHAKVYYRYQDGGSPTSEYTVASVAVERLKDEFGALPIRNLGVAQLKQVRERMLDDDLTRSTINGYVSRIVRMVRWAVEEELAPAHVYGALRALRPLPRGRSRARETEPRKPVEWKTVKKTLPRLSPQLRALVLVMWHSGMRCGEAVQLRTRDVDMTAKAQSGVSRSSLAFLRRAATASAGRNQYRSGSSRTKGRSTAWASGPRSISRVPPRCAALWRRARNTQPRFIRQRTGRARGTFVFGRYSPILAFRSWNA